MPSLHIEGDGRILSDRAPWGPVNCEYVVSRQFGVEGGFSSLVGNPQVRQRLFGVSQGPLALFSS